jgi:hypothetical protein
MSNNGISIADLEKAVLEKRYQDAENYLYPLVIAFFENRVEFTTAPFDRELSREQQELESYQVIEKLATIFTVWFSDWNYEPSDECYAFVCLQKSFFNNLFAASSYHSTDHILANLQLIGKTDYSPLQLKRLLFVITLESLFELPWAILFKHLPDATIKAYAGMLRSINIQMSSRAQNSVNNLVEGAKHATLISTDQVENLSPLISCYFNVSNLAHPDKYAIKQWVVRCFESFMKKYLPEKLQLRIAEDVKKSPNKDKPKVLVFHEFYHDKHAMYRGHHPRIAALKNHFHTIGMGIEGQFDELGQQDFDDNVIFDVGDKLNVIKMIETILDIKPDIIYYPSVGMSMFLPLITCVRLAPIQIASAGHPSSTYSKKIDYFHFLDMEVEHRIMENILYEKWLPFRRSGLRRKDMEHLPKHSNLDGSVTNILINGVIQKVSHSMISVCKRITEQSSSKIIFHVFMAHPKQDIEYFASKSLLRRFLPNSQLHSFRSYDDYMAILNDCDFALGTYPFGGTNSNVDLLRLNKPKLFVVNYDDLSGLTDLDIWKTVGYLDGQCQDLDELVQKACQWSDDSALLEKNKNRMKEMNLIGKLQTECNSDASSELSDSLKHLIKSFTKNKLAG